MTLVELIEQQIPPEYINSQVLVLIVLDAMAHLDPPILGTFVGDIVDYEHLTAPNIPSEDDLVNGIGIAVSDIMGSLLQQSLARLTAKETRLKKYRLLQESIDGDGFEYDPQNQILLLMNAILGGDPANDGAVQALATLWLQIDADTTYSPPIKVHP